MVPRIKSSLIAIFALYGVSPAFADIPVPYACPDTEERCAYVKSASDHCVKDLAWRWEAFRAQADAALLKTRDRIRFCKRRALPLRPAGGPCDQARLQLLQPSVAIAMHLLLDLRNECTAAKNGPLCRFGDLSDGNRSSCNRFKSYISAAQDLPNDYNIRRTWLLNVARVMWALIDQRCSEVRKEAGDATCATEPTPTPTSTPTATATPTSTPTATLPPFTGFPPTKPVADATPTPTPSTTLTPPLAPTLTPTALPTIPPTARPPSK